MEALHKDGEDGDHHKIEGMMMEFSVEPCRWRPLWFQRPYYSQFDMIIYVPMMFTFLFYYFGIHKHSVGLLIKAIEMVLDFLAWGWEPGHWMQPNKQ
jgi:hypothetical protein